MSSVLEIASPQYQMIRGVLRRCNGRLPTPPDFPRVHLSGYLHAKALPAPAPFDWTQKISNFPLDGNDSQGDCVAAYMFHKLQVLSLYGSGAELRGTTAQCLSVYHTIGGPGDNGLDPNQALAWWAKNPLMPGDKPISAFATINYTNTNLILQGGGLFGGVGYSVDLPANFADALNAGQPWTDTSAPPDRIKGHEMYIAKAEADGPTYITWGQKQKATWAWHNRYGVDCHVAISPWWLGSLDPSGVDVATLLADYAAITGQTPPPIVPPGPPVPPTPPGPTPSPASLFSLTFRQAVMAGRPVQFRAPVNIAAGTYQFDHAPAVAEATPG